MMKGYCLGCSFKFLHGDVLVLKVTGFHADGDPVVAYMHERCVLPADER